MDLAALKAELSGVHPGTALAYDSDDAIAAEQLNAVNRTRNRNSMTGSEVLNSIDSGEWSTRTAEQKQVIWDIVHLGDVNPFGVEATLITDAFSGAGGLTMAALAAARLEPISRAVELEFGFVKVGYVEQARAF